MFLITGVMNKILVTGGLGFIGYHLVKKLLQDKKNKITIFDNLISDSASVENELSNKETFDRLVYIYEDINFINENRFKNLNFDVIYHLGALARIQPSFEKPDKYFWHNIHGTISICQLARRCNAKIVFAGSSSTYGGNRMNPYTFSKYTGEQTLMMYSEIYNVSTVIARFFNVYGDRQPISGDYPTLIGIYQEAFKQKEPMTIVGSGEQRRDFTNVSDIVNGLLILAKGEYYGEIFNIGTGKNYSILEVAKMFSDEVQHIPARRGESKVTLADITEIKKLGYKPTINLKDYVANFRRAVDKKRGSKPS